MTSQIYVLSKENLEGEIREALENECCKHRKIICVKKAIIHPPADTFERIFIYIHKLVSVNFLPYFVRIIIHAESIWNASLHESRFLFLRAFSGSSVSFTVMSQFSGAIDVVENA